MRVIARKGMSAATMQEIAREAGVAKGTIYLYFRDRDELVERTFETAIGELRLRIDAALELDVPFEEKLRAIFAAKIKFFGENAEFFRLYASLRIPEGTPRQQRRQKQTCQPQYQAAIEKVTQFLKEAMDRGEIREADPTRLAIYLVEGSTAIVLERLSEASPPPAEEDVDFLVRLTLDGIGLRKKRGTH